ncbi:MAG: hypothetical protein A2284_14140 [Deltaproteobacteria bacterium RIFOXYA12_FULL_61_11]|nr:MAG: hypothetical protein A2284_14140 [Deltaproteobacteria bacterium RIFOXYA12_FULL_61_11]
MDIFTILLVFLLKSYSVTEAVLIAPKDVALPTSTSQIDPKVSIDIQISKTSVVFDGKPVVAVIDGKIDRSYYDENNLIAPLLKVIQDKLKSFEYIAQLRQDNAPQVEDTGEEGEEEDETAEKSILVMAHKELDFKVVEDVLYTAAGAGVGKFRFAVQKLGE